MKHCAGSRQGYSPSWATERRTDLPKTTQLFPRKAWPGFLTGMRTFRNTGTATAVQRLRCCASMAGCRVSTPGQGTKTLSAVGVQLKVLFKKKRDIRTQLLSNHLVRSPSLKQENRSSERWRNVHKVTQQGVTDPSQISAGQHSPSSALSSGTVRPPKVSGAVWLYVQWKSLSQPGSERTSITIELSI